MRSGSRLRTSTSSFRWSKPTTAAASSASQRRSRGRRVMIVLVLVLVLVLEKPGTSEDEDEDENEGEKGGSRIEIPLQRFAGGGILQAPLAVGVSPGPSLRQRGSAQGARELKPQDSIGRRAVTGVSAVLHRRFHLARGGGRARGVHWERCFGELNEGFSGGVGPKKNFTRDLRRGAFGAPESLSGAHRP